MQATRAVAVVTAMISAVATIAFALLPQLHLEYQWPAVRLALETSGSLIALVAAFLVFGRLLRRTYLNELLLACALAVLAMSNLLFVTVPTVAGWAPDDLTVWAAPLARSLGALLFVLAAFAARRDLRQNTRPPSPRWRCPSRRCAPIRLCSSSNCWWRCFTACRRSGS